MPITMEDGASDPLVRKLAAAGSLTRADRTVLAALCRSYRRIAAGRDIISQGDRPSDLHLVLDGFACRYKLIPKGYRQIVAVLVPGDFCDLHVAILGEMDHSIAAITDCTVVDISAATVRDLTENHPRIAHALRWATLVDEAVLREWMASLGRREAAERMAHLFCELLMRLQQVGLADKDGYDLPISQTDLADVLGLTTVHVNRTLRHLREMDLVVLKRRRLSVIDVSRLKTFCDFDPSYLHLGTRRAEALG